MTQIVYLAELPEQVQEEWAALCCYNREHGIPIPRFSVWLHDYILDLDSPPAT